MRRSGRALAGLVLFAVAFHAVPAHAQVSASNILEARVGSDPFDPTQPTNRLALYDGLDLGYVRDRLRLGLRFETARNSQDTFEYATVTQRFADWTDERVRARVGNFYTILGSGLIHRSFEVPGVVLDPPGEDSPYQLARDVDGALVEASAGPVAVRGLLGSPNGGTESPAVADEGGPARHSGNLGGGQIEVTPRPGVRAGAAYARFSASTFAGTNTSEHGSGFAALDPLALAGVTRSAGISLPLYAEYAQTNASFADWFKFRTGDDVPHALYAGANLLWGVFSLSAEWKDYEDFRLGTNDPPSLVRESAFPLLNRNTHVLNATSEQGYQLEATAAGPGWGAFTINLSRADGAPSGFPVRYEEHYVELAVPSPGAGRTEATFFWDRGFDQYVFIDFREIYGGSAMHRLDAVWSVSADVEFLRAVRAPGVGYRDWYTSLQVARAEWGSLGIVWDRSTDPAVEDPDRPGEPSVYLSGNASARITRSTQALLFVGERRLQLACTAGTCYEVPAFRGVELRLLSRF